MSFSRNYLVHYYEADGSRRLSLPALVQYFEDIAILHSASHGLDLEYFHANHCGWMLLKWDIAIHALPSFGETVTLSTRVHAMKRFLADREFRLIAENGIILAEARSNWLFADTDKRRPLRVPEEQYAFFDVSPQSESSFVSIPDVSPVLPGSPGEKTQSLIRTANGDIDTNRHVNNVRYVTWALDALPADFAFSHSPLSLRVQYRKELSLGAEVSVLSSIENPVSEFVPAGRDRRADGAEPRVATRHTFSGADEEYCSIEIVWAPSHG